MTHRPAIGARVRLAGRYLHSAWRGKQGTVVAHHPDAIAIVVRLDPQKPLRRYQDRWRAFDRKVGLTFRRRIGDVVLDYPDVRALRGGTPC